MAKDGSTQTLIQPESISLSRYEILREIGRGATSTVYLGRDRTLGVELALKVFHPPARLASEAGQRFFVRHAGDWAPAELRRLDIKDGTGAGMAMIVERIQ